jgi:geranylgeranylglycerol-phosphate geranylgeranyltransferase
MIKKLHPYVIIARPLNLVIVFFTVLVAGFICSKNNEIILNNVLAGISASFIAAAGYVINDYFDIKIDKVNRPWRPLASGRISIKSAIIFYSAASLIGLALALKINTTIVAIAVFTEICVCK